MTRCLIYSSQPADAAQKGVLEALVALARLRNQAVGVTSRIVRMEHHYVQAIEGEPDAVAEVFARISADRRHHSVIVALDAPMASRFFPGLPMDVVTRADLRESDYARLDDAVRQSRHPKADLWIDGWRLLEPLTQFGSAAVRDTGQPAPGDLRALQAVDRMLGQARRIGLEEGPQALTVEKVADASDVTIRTARRLFPRPGDLIGAMVRQTVVHQFRQFQLRLQQMRFTGDAELARFVAAHVTRTYLSDRALPSAIKLFALRRHHEINYEGFAVLAAEMAAAMDRGGVDTYDPMLEPRLCAGLAGVAAAMKMTALQHPALLKTPELESMIAGLFLGALRGTPPNPG